MGLRASTEPRHISKSAEKMAALLGMVVPALALMTAPGLTRAPRRARVHASEATMAEGSGRDGHVFVVHGDVLSLSADAVLVPTRNLNNRKWFPSGAPAGGLHARLPREPRRRAAEQLRRSRLLARPPRRPLRS